MQYKDRGIILKRTNLGEADRIITILTEYHGKIRVVAKGIRKTLSKMAGHLEPFCLSRLQITEGKSLDIITSAELEKCFISVRSDLSKTKTGFYLAEIAEKMIPDNESHPEIFGLLDETLENLDKLPAELAVPYFEFNFLAETGFSPELSKCVSCGEELIPGKNNFDFASGGLTCAGCEASFRVSDEAIKVLRLFLSHSLNAISKIKITENLVKEIKNITSHYLKHIHQKDFKSERFLT